MKKNVVLSIIIFIVVFGVYVTSPIITSYDSRWSVHTSLSIIHEGNTDLDEYKKQIVKNKYYAIENINGHYYTIFPVGTYLLSVPFVAIAEIIFEPLINLFPALSNLFKEKLAQHGRHVAELKFIHIYPAVELVIASFIGALTSVVIWLIARIRLPVSYAGVVVFIFAFCTSSWSVCSRALWQHGPSMLMLSCSIYLLLIQDKEGSSVHFMAIPLAFAFIIRPTNAIPVFFISFYIFVNYKHAFMKYILVAAPIAIVYFGFNMSIYGKILSNYYSPDRVFHLSRFMEALAGNIYSPSRGLFIYSPILLVSLYGFIRFFPNKNNLRNSYILLFLIIIFCHWLLVSSFPHWWAGHSYGPRFFADMIPLFIFSVILVFEQIAVQKPIKQAVILLSITPFLIFSFYVHYKGAYIHAVYEWNITPTNIDADPGRLWDWNDMQMFRK
jgi:hypothetical protein